MASVSKSQSQAAQDLIANYTALDPTGTVPDISPGTVNRDIVDAVADLISQAYVHVENTREMASLSNAPLLSTDAMSPLGLNWDMTQLQPSTALGTVYFQRFIPPTKIVDFPAGTIVQTQPALNGTVVRFVTTAAARLTPQTPLNTSNYRYEVSAPIVAMVTGSIGNVGPGAINQLATPNRNIDTVINKTGTTNGTDLEDNTTFANRILAKTAGTTFGTAAGTAAGILAAFPGVISTVVAGPTDPAMVRAQYGDEVDVYLLGTSFGTFSDLLTISGLPTDNLKTHPVVALTSVNGTTTGTVYSVGTDVVLAKDTSPIFGNSARAFDKIQWLTAHRPGAAQTVTVGGFYDSNVVAVQNYLSLPTTRFVTEDILAKSATRVGIVIQAQISAFTGYDRGSLISNVQAAIINGISNYFMGQSVLQSDVVDIIAATPGVAEVQIPLTQLRTSTDLPGTVDDEITILKNAYARTDQVIIISA